MPFFVISSSKRLILFFFITCVLICYRKMTSTDCFCWKHPNFCCPSYGYFYSKRLSYGFRMNPLAWICFLIL